MNVMMNVYRRDSTKKSVFTVLGYHELQVTIDSWQIKLH